MSFGDGGGEFAFAVVAVAVADGPPVVDHGDGVQVDRVRVLAVGAQRVERGAQVVGAAFGADRGEGGGVAAGLGEEVSAEAEHVRPPAQVQARVVGAAAELPRGGDHAAVVVGQPQVLHVGDVADRPVDAVVGAGALGGVLGDVGGERGVGHLPRLASSS